MTVRLPLLSALALGSPSTESSHFRPDYLAEMAATVLPACLLGPSPAMSRLWNQLRRAAPVLRAALLTGEADCGQEAAARLLLEMSAYPGRGFLRVAPQDFNPFALPSVHELSPDGLFLFLPELDRLCAAGQQSVLRLLRTPRARPVTVVAASHEDLRLAASCGRFSPELLARLSAVRIALPPLRSRSEDLPLLLTQLLSERHPGGAPGGSCVSPGLCDAAARYAWPGNLRQLATVADRLAAMSQPVALSRFHAALEATAPTPARHNPVPGRRLAPLDHVVREHVVTVMEACQGNKLRAAAVLGVSRSTLYRLLEPAAEGNRLSASPSLLRPARVAMVA